MSVNESRDIGNSQSNSNVSHNICGRGFTTNRGLLLYLNARRRKQQEQQNRQLETNDDQENTYRPQDMPLEPINSYWKEKPGTTFVNELSNAYDKIAYWRKKLFLLPTGTMERSFIDKMERMINAWVYDRPIKDIALNVLHAMPALLLQKPIKSFKSKDHLKSVEKRFEI